MTRSRWIGVIVIGAALAGAARSAVHATPDVQVERAEVTAGPITRQVVAAGSVQAVTTVEVGAQVPGVVQSLGADFNTLVHAGQVIANLDPSLYQANVEQAQAGLRQAQATLGQAQADLAGLHVADDDARMKLARAQSLSAAQQLTNADLDAARIAVLEAGDFVRAQEGQVAEARADVDQARAVVTQAALNLDRTVIRSPIDGIVVDREVEVGQTLAVSLTFRVVPADAVGPVESALDKEQARAVVIIPEHFGRDLERGQSPEVQWLIDGTDANTANLVRGNAAGLTQAFNNQFGVSVAPAIRGPFPSA